MTTATMVRMLGGEKEIGHPIKTTSDFIEVIRKGLKYESLETFVSEMGLSREKVIKALALVPRTIARRKSGTRLTIAESDRLYRLVYIAAKAEEVLGSKEKASKWLVTANRALNNAMPLELLDTDEGSRQVASILGRLEYGVFS